MLVYWACNTWYCYYEERKEEKSKNHQPEILDVEVKEIPEQKPPNDKIISYNLNKKNKNILDKK